MVKEDLDGRLSKDVNDHTYPDRYRKGDMVTLICQDSGPEAYGSTIWDLTVDNVWVPDAYVKTGSDGWAAGVPRCAPGAGPAAPAPGTTPVPAPTSAPAPRPTSQPSSNTRTFLVKEDLDGRLSKDVNDHTYPDRYRKGDMVTLICQDSGPEAYGSTIWDLTVDNVWVPDAYVKTGSDGWAAGVPRCAPGAGPKAPAPAPTSDPAPESTTTPAPAPSSTTNAPPTPGPGPSAATAQVYPFAATQNLDGRLTKDVNDHTYPDRYRKGQIIDVLCQAEGGRAYGSALWDLTSENLWVPDKYVKTGTDGRAAGVPDCDALPSRPGPSGPNGSGQPGTPGQPGQPGQPGTVPSPPLTVAGTAPAPLLNSDWANLFNLRTGKCVDVPNNEAGTIDGPVLQWACRYGTGDNQQWSARQTGVREGQRVYEVRNRKDDLCLDVTGLGTVAPGTPVSEYTCASDTSGDVEADNQSYYAVASTVHGAFKLRNVASPDLCLDVAGHSTGGDDARLTLWPCEDADDHLWALRKNKSSDAGTTNFTVKKGIDPIRPRSAPDHIIPDGAVLRPGTRLGVVCQTKGTNDPDEVWYRLPDGTYLERGVLRATDENADEDILACGGGKAEDLAVLMSAATSFEELDAAWASLGAARQQDFQWKALRASELKRVAQGVAMSKMLALGTGRTANDWQTEAGLVEQTIPIVWAVYTYYGQLSAACAECQWAGLAKLAGGPVYAGMQDMQYVDLNKVGPAFKEIDEDNKEMARLLLTMQKDIFVDLAWQHELYIAEGIDGMRAIEQGGGGPWRNPDWADDDGTAGQQNAQWVDGGPVTMISAWEDIASGDATRIARGNKVLVAREQDPVLQRSYNKMSKQFLLQTFATGVLAASPVPAGTPFRDVKGSRAASFLPYPARPQQMSYEDDRLPMSVAWWKDRQHWVYEYIFPEYMAAWSADPTRMRAEIDLDLNERIKRYRNAGLKDNFAW